MIVPLVEFGFLLSVVIVLYVYIGYPVLVYSMSLLRGRPVLRSKFEPTVSVVVTAYNEEKNIREKIENTLLIDYPAEKFEIIIASDGSTDGTDAIVREYSHCGVTLLRQEGRVGKTATQNAAVVRAAGEIILFSDATSMYQRDVLSAILPNFGDATVGCVAGKLIYVDEAGSSIGNGAQKYWSYEKLLKESESRACSLIGVSGCLYAVRKSAYIPMYPEACSDFLIASVIYKQGMRTVYEPAAVCTEETNQKAAKEMSMRVRIITQTISDLWRNREMLNPIRTGFYGLQLISHKVLRYLVPVFLVLIFATSLILAPASTFFAGVALFQGIFYLSALGAWMLERSGKRAGVLAIPLYFVLANIASVLGFYKFLSGERYARWEPIRGT